MRQLTIVLIVLTFFASTATAQDKKRKRLLRPYPPKIEGTKVEVYKTIGDVKLNMYLFTPEGHQATDKRPAVVFFFGGGWTTGTPTQFQEQCRYLASRGMVAMVADYRVSSRHGTKAKACVTDGKSAVRWMRTNAKRLGIDPQRIAAGGGSAGGHVAACTGTITDFEEQGEATSISSVPNAMVLFNPAVALADVEGKSPVSVRRMTVRCGVDSKKLSPYHHVKKGAPPTILFHGKSDSVVPYWTVEAFAAAMKKAGNRCELKGYEGQKHGFFNHGRGGDVYYTKTVLAMDEFFVSLGYLKGRPTIKDVEN